VARSPLREGFPVGRAARGVLARPHLGGRGPPPGEDVGPRDFAERETLEWDPLPCWAHLSREEHRKRAREAIEDIELKTAQRHRETGKTPLGPAAILAAAWVAGLTVTYGLFAAFVVIGVDWLTRPRRASVGVRVGA
jgi:hypothetical protein